MPRPKLVLILLQNEKDFNETFFVWRGNSKLCTTKNLHFANTMSFFFLMQNIFHTSECTRTHQNIPSEQNAMVGCSEGVKYTFMTHHYVIIL